MVKVYYSVGGLGSWMFQNVFLLHNNHFGVRQPVNLGTPVLDEAVSALWNSRFGERDSMERSFSS
jgi:hypothetical protein